nr:hypothetical protein BaRGS_025633 [Batillaria attramentaria]KAG5702037.1 hypothetical protein BaRGS_015772 [Batillaria attramentaria]
MIMIMISFDNSSTLTGTPPDLTLTVRLDNVRKEEEGQWRLELANDAGTGHVDFELTADPGAGHGHEDTNTDGTSSDSSAGVNVPLMGGVIVGVNVGTVIIVTIIVLIIGMCGDLAESASLNQWRNRKWSLHPSPLPDKTRKRIA